MSNYVSAHIFKRKTGKAYFHITSVSFVEEEKVNIYNMQLDIVWRKKLFQNMQGPTKVDSPISYAKRALEFWKMVKHVFNENKGDIFGYKILAAGGGS